MLKKFLVLILTAAFLFSNMPVVIAADGGIDAQVSALEKQLKTQQELIMELKTQLEALKKQVSAGGYDRKTDERITKLEEKSDNWYEKAFKEGELSLQDAVGLEEDSLLNIGGELKMRYRQNVDKTADSQGFQFYELELFMDAVLNDYSAIYVEYNLMHSNQPDPEDVWIDFHLSPDQMAYGGGTGVKIGNFHYPFGWDNDDNEGYVYGGRSTVNVPLVRSERIDGWRLRERQIGVAGNYNFDVKDLNVTMTAGIFNGNGSWLNYGGNDNDQRKDLAGRLEFKYADFVIGTSYLFAPRTTHGITANANNTQHIRDIHRFGVHFKYPDVPFPGQDISLGGSKWMVWGEYVGGINKSSDITAAASRTARPQGGYLEFDYSIIDDKLLFFVRGDLYDPDSSIKDNTVYAVTPGIRWNFFGSSFLTAEWELYDGDTNAPSSVTKDDRITVEVATMF